jgi:hypothetical protein
MGTWQTYTSYIKYQAHKQKCFKYHACTMTHLCNMIWGLYVWNIKNNCFTCVFQLDSCLTINTELNTWGLLVKQGSLAEWTSKVKPMVTIPGIASTKQPCCYHLTSPLISPCVNSMQFATHLSPCLNREHVEVLAGSISQVTYKM